MRATVQRVLPVVLLIAVTTPALADHDHESRIFRADVDLADGLLFINGRELPRREPKVVLGNTRLEVVSFSRTDIVAKIPPGTAPATYQLSVAEDIHFVVSVGDTGPEGPQGPQGPRGDTGATGPQGLKGDTGATGPQGPQGLKGDTGATGPQGLKGDTGATGPQGLQGDAGPMGPQGLKGDTGSQGPQGLKGDTGSQGPQGLKGDTGSQGLIGPQGLSGLQGLTGPQGPTGPIGPQGLSGPTGPQGSIGPIGPQGPAGSFTATTCTYVTGAFVAGTSGPLDVTTVSCPGTQFAVGIIPTWQVWAFATACVPVSVRGNNQNVSTIWFSSASSTGTGCRGNSIATMTLCCP